MARPASAPHTTVRRRGRTTASTTPHPREIAPWASTPAAARPARRGVVREEEGSGGSDRLEGRAAGRQCVHGRRSAAQHGCDRAGPQADSKAHVSIDDNDADHDSRGAAVPVLLPDQPRPRSTSTSTTSRAARASCGAASSDQRAPSTRSSARAARRRGAGFPTGRKWASILGGGPEVGDRYAVGNGARASRGRSRTGCSCAGTRTRSSKGSRSRRRPSTVGCTSPSRRRSSLEIEALSRALREMSEAGLVGDVPITLVTGPEEYLFGEEKALLEVIEVRTARACSPVHLRLVHVHAADGWSAGIDLSSDGVAVPARTRRS